MRFPEQSVTHAAIILFVVILAASAAEREAADLPHGGTDVTCEACHDMQSGGLRKKPAFSHDATRFPLVGAHRTTTCAACHPGLIFRGVPRQCSRCHEDIHNGEHGLDCARCHEPTSFLRVDDFTGFHEETRFPLEGAHRTAECADCHVRGGREVWKGLNTACAACHYDEYRNTSKPSHTAAGFGTDCARCHSPASGFGGAFDHDATAFPLTGAHRAVSCRACHTSTVYRGLPSACAACHDTDYRSATEPDHTAARFSTSCVDCHGTTAWIPSSYDHSHTGFALVGAHGTVSCGACHPNRVYAGTSPACFSCHTDDYSHTAEPPHASLGLTQSCGDCHTTGSWRPAPSFVHTAVFPLAGAHAGVSCTVCHTPQNPRKPPSDCWSCHAGNYAAAKDHILSRFPRECTQCHTMSAWKPSTFTHPWFSIYSGEHKGKWKSCTDCHTVPGDFTVYSCAKCHKNRTAD